MISFRKPFQVIYRRSGLWIDGRYVPAPEPDPVGIMASEQAAKPTDFDKMEASSFGRRTNHAIRIYTDAYLSVAEAARGAHTGVPGDIFLGSRGRYLIIGSSDFRNLPKSRTSHSRYLAVLEKEAEGAFNVA